MYKVHGLEPLTDLLEALFQTIKWSMYFQTSIEFIFLHNFSKGMMCKYMYMQFLKVVSSTHGPALMWDSENIHKPKSGSKHSPPFQGWEIQKLSLRGIHEVWGDTSSACREVWVYLANTQGPERPGWHLVSTKLPETTFGFMSSLQRCRTCHQTCSQTPIFC